MGRKRRKRPKKLAGKLRVIRLALGWTQTGLGKRLEVDSGAISRFENGQREPSPLELLAYARLAGVTVESLIDDKMSLPK